MAAAYHVILSSYGFWLPNDPRGSWSTQIGNRALRKFGVINGHRTKQKIDDEQKQQLNAERRALVHPPVRFTGRQAQFVGYGFGKCQQNYRLVIWACAILPNHTHLMIAHHPTLSIDLIVNQLKGAATRELNKANLNPRQQQRFPIEKDCRLSGLATLESISKTLTSRSIMLLPIARTTQRKRGSHDRIGASSQNFGD